MSQLAWSAPKQARRKLINRLLQVGANAIFCFRAKEKIKFAGKEKVELGLQPIGGDEFIYEFTANFLLYPGCKGIPTYRPELDAERSIVKLSHDFAAIEGQQLTEEVGQLLYRWSIGEDINSAAKDARERIRALLEKLNDEDVKTAAWKTAKKTSNLQTLARVEKRLMEIVP